MAEILRGPITALARVVVAPASVSYVARFRGAATAEDLIFSCSKVYVATQAWQCLRVNPCLCDNAKSVRVIGGFDPKP